MMLALGRASLTSCGQLQSAFLTYSHQLSNAPLAFGCCRPKSTNCLRAMILIRICSHFGNRMTGEIKVIRKSSYSDPLDLLDLLDCADPLDFLPPLIVGCYYRHNILQTFSKSTTSLSKNVNPSPALTYLANPL